VANRYFTVGFDAKFSATRANCRANWWVNGTKFPVPSANLDSFITGGATRGIFTAHSSAGAATAVKVLAARMMAQFPNLL
jgi:hypothetical protein